MKRAAIAALVIGVLVVLSQLTGTLVLWLDASRGQPTEGSASAAPVLPPGGDTTFNGVRY